MEALKFHQLFPWAELWQQIGGDFAFLGVAVSKLGDEASVRTERELVKKERRRRRDALSSCHRLEVSSERTGAMVNLKRSRTERGTVSMSLAKETWS